MLYQWFWIVLLLCFSSFWCRHFWLRCLALLSLVTIYVHHLIKVDPQFLLVYLRSLLSSTSCSSCRAVSFRVTCALEPRFLTHLLDSRYMLRLYLSFLNRLIDSLLLHLLIELSAFIDFSDMILSHDLLHTSIRMHLFLILIGVEIQAVNALHTHWMVKWLLLHSCCSLGPPIFLPLLLQNLHILLVKLKVFGRLQEPWL